MVPLGLAQCRNLKQQRPYPPCPLPAVRTVNTRTTLQDVAQSKVHLAYADDSSMEELDNLLEIPLGVLAARELKRVEEQKKEGSDILQEQGYQQERGSLYWELYALACYAAPSRLPSCVRLPTFDG